MAEPPAEAVTDQTLRLRACALAARATREGWLQLVGDTVALPGAQDDADPALGILIPVDRDWPIRLQAAQRLHDRLTGKRPRRWFTAQRRLRIANALRTDDARQTGAVLRDIAIAYFGAKRVTAEPWKTSALKAQTLRLASYGRRLTRTGYLQILRGRTASRRRTH